MTHHRKNVKTPQHPPADEWMDRRRGGRAGDYYPAIKWNKVLVRATARMSLKDTTLRQTSNTKGHILMGPIYVKLQGFEERKVAGDC